MVDLAPSPPKQEAQEYFNWSKPISDPKVFADESAKYTGAAIGGALDDFSKTIDSTYKQHIQDRVYDQVENLRDERTGQLLKQWNATKGKGTVGGDDPDTVLPDASEPSQNVGYPPGVTQASFGKPSASTDIIPATPATPDIPPSLQAGLDKGASLGAASADPKVTSTVYDMKLAALQKQLRAQFPGYRPYIDQQFSSVTGKDPANAVMVDMQNDINRSAALGRSAQNKVLNMGYSAIKDGTSPYMVGLVEKYKSDPNGQNELNILNEINRSSTQKNKDETYLRQIQVSAGQQGQRSDIARTFVAQSAAAASAAFQTATFTLSGLLDKPETLEEIQKGMNDGTIKAPPSEVSERLGLEMRQHAAKIYQTELQKYNQPIPERDDKGNLTGKSMGSIVDMFAGKMDDVKSVLDKQFKEPTEAFINTISSGDVRMASLSKAVTEDSMNDEKNKYIHMPGMVQPFALMKLINETVGPNYAGPIIQDFIGSNLLDLNKTVIRTNLAKAMAQPGLRPGGDGTVATFAKDMEQYRQDLLKNGKDPNIYMPEYAQKFLSGVHTIMTPGLDDGVKAAMAKYYFDSSNYNLVNTFNLDYTKEDGTKVAGRLAAWSLLHSPGMSHEMSRLGEKDVGLWQMYKSNTERQAISLFGQELSNLREYVNNGGKFNWNPTANRLEAIDSNNNVITGKTTGSMGPIAARNQGVQILAKLEPLFSGLGSMFKYSHEDVGNFMFNVLSNSSIDVNKFGNVPAELKAAFEHAKVMSPQQKAKELEKDPFANKTGDKSQDRVTPKVTYTGVE